MMTVPHDLKEWIATLPNREGWGGWDSVGNSVYEGVQNWSATGDVQTAVGVWGNVTPYPGSDSEEPEGINWCVYIGDSQDPEREGFADAEAAMRWAEVTYPERF
jgi:hypothetical protein